MDRPNPLSQRDVAPSMRRHRSSIPGVKTALGNPQQSAHFPYRTVGLVCLHEPEERFDVAGISFANQAAAFESISRSSLSRRFSRRSLVSSSRSVVVRPPSPAPPSRSSRLTHCRIDQGVTPNSLPSSSKRRPVRCNSTICRRNSGVYRLRAFAILIPFLCEHEWSTKTGQAQIDLGKDPHLVFAIPFVIAAQYDKWDELRRLVHTALDRLRLCELLDSVPLRASQAMQKWVASEVDRMSGAK